jgi:exopolyphosphatase/guanosine-5'-triphosphate,3'-diphosphate pyrophosphatase
VPKKSHQEYAGLPAPLRRTVRTLASILRVAESLDRTHAQVVSGLELEDRGEDLLIQLHTRGDAELELWATTHHLEPFGKLVGKPVRLAVVHRPPTVAN